MVQVRQLVGRRYSGQEWSSLGKPLYHVSREQLSAGQTLDTVQGCRSHHSVFFTKTPPPEFAAVADYMARRQVEATFEQVRAAKNPDAPPREKAVFASLTSADAEAWIAKGARRSGRVFLLQPIANPVLWVTNYIWFNYAVRVQKGLVSSSGHLLVPLGSADEEVACSGERYWKGESLSVPDTTDKYEVLVTGRMVVVSSA